MPRASLKAVSASDRPRRTAPASVLSATESDDRVGELVAMRRVVARAIDNPDTSARDLAALTRRLTEISKELESLRARHGSEGDQIESLDDEVFDPQVI